ncbi:MAG: hypothetical protein HOV81_00440 [Kofleriaceae bacterium]|nr:hypothetical protein [Kofleriaceae bacterium]
MTDGLAGHDPAYLRLLWIVVSLCGITAVAILVVVYRHAKDRAELEQAEQILAEDERD